MTEKCLKCGTPEISPKEGSGLSMLHFECGTIIDKVSGIYLVGEDCLRNQVAQLEAEKYAQAKCINELEAFASNLAFRLANAPVVVKGIVVSAGDTTHYAQIEAPCDLPVGSEGMVIFLQEETNNV